MATTERNAQGVDVLAVMDRRIAWLQRRRDDQATFVRGDDEWFAPPKGEGARQVLAAFDASLAEAKEARAAVAELVEADKEYDEARAAVNVRRNAESVTYQKRATARRAAALARVQGGAA